jgi:tRNA A-37 threonylcarbamoyl transferase component Bud32
VTDRSPQSKAPRSANGGSGRLTSFDFDEGKMLLKKYRIVEKLGQGWEGEVYRVREALTGVERAAKFFFPHRNIQNQALKFYARKLHKLRHCPVSIQYVTEERLVVQGQEVRFLVSELAEGKVLPEFLKQHPGGRLTPFEALHLLHALSAGMAAVHQLRESHGDLHTQNVMVRRQGLEFEVKVFDFFRLDAGKHDQYQDDVYGLVNILYECVGGKKHYSRQPPVIKGIVRGLKSSLIRQKFRNAIQLRDYLDNLEWD